MTVEHALSIAGIVLSVVSLIGFILATIGAFLVKQHNKFGKLLETIGDKLEDAKDMFEHTSDPMLKAYLSDKIKKLQSQKDALIMKKVGKYYAR